MSSFIFTPNQEGLVPKRRYNKPLTTGQWKMIEDDVRAWHLADRNVKSIADLVHRKHGLEISYAQLWRQTRKWGLRTTKTEAEVASSIRQVMSPAWPPFTASSGLSHTEQLTRSSPELDTYGTTSDFIDLTKEEADALVAKIPISAAVRDMVRSMPDLPKVKVIETYSVTISESRQAYLQGFDDLAATFIEFLRVHDLLVLALVMHEIATVSSHEVLTHVKALESICEGFSMRLYELFRHANLENEETIVSELAPLIVAVDGALDADESVVEFFKHVLLGTLNEDKHAELTRCHLLVVAFIVDNYHMVDGRGGVKQRRNDPAADSDLNRPLIVLEICQFLHFLSVEGKESSNKYAELPLNKQSILATHLFGILLLAFLGKEEKDQED